MGGCRCTFRNCKSATKTNGDLHFFHYPVKHKERCNEWIKNARRADFYILPDDQLRNKVVCDLHFERYFFTNALRKRLVHNAIPTLAIGCEDEILNEGRSEFGNIEILPANDDGTIFTLGTDSLQNNKMEDPISTYSFKNGTLVPVYEEEPEERESEQVMYTMDAEDYKVVPNFTDQSQSNYVFVNTNTNSKQSDNAENYEIVFNGESQPPTIAKKELRSTHSIEITTKPYPRKEAKITSVQPPPRQEPMEIVYLSEHTHRESPIEFTQINPFEREISVSETSKSSSYESVKDVKCEPIVPKVKNSGVVQVKKKFMKRINHHSREIASLKRALMQTNLKKSSKVNVNQFKGKVPPTMFGAFTINLYKKKSNFSQSEVDFLTTLYKSSPECYNLLIDRLHWDLPDPSVVENLIKPKITTIVL